MYWLKWRLTNTLQGHFTESVVDANRQTFTYVQNDDPVSLTLDLLKPKPIVFDIVSRITTVPSFK